MSVRMVSLITLADGVTGAAAAELAARLASCPRDVAEIGRAHAGLHGPGSLGGGDLTWDLLFESETGLDAFLARGGRREGTEPVAALGPAHADVQRAVAGSDAVALQPIATHVGRRGLAGIKRTLFFRVREATEQATLERFEGEMLAMPGFVSAIRNWWFSRVRPEPRSRWTHVWEQEFESEAGLSNDYMASPYHWGHIDAWFDPECPHAIVDPRIAHVYCRASESVLSWPER